jgi:hypothetical protein
MARFKVVAKGIAGKEGALAKSQKAKRKNPQTKKVRGRSIK